MQERDFCWVFLATITDTYLYFFSPWTIKKELVLGPMLKFISCSNLEVEFTCKKLGKNFKNCARFRDLKLFELKLNLSSIKGRLPSMVLFHQRLSSIKGHLPLKAVFHQKLSSIKYCPPSKVVFHQRLSHQLLSSNKCPLPSKVLFHQR